MIVQILLKALLVITIVGIVQIGYNAWIYRQFGFFRWVKLIMLTLVSLVVAYILWGAIEKISTIKYLSSVLKFFDSILFTFFSFVPSKFILYWIIFPLLVAWIFYLLNTLRVVLVTRWRFYRWQKKNESEELLRAENSIESLESDSDINELESKNEEIESKSIHFLEVDTVKIRYKSILGLQRAYEKSKNEGLQISETDNGYIAVYASSEGVKQLRELFKMHNLDKRKLNNRPSVVFFDKENVSCIGIKEALESMKAGDTIDFNY
ncbi:TPA: hypothetical protein QFM54_001865 [Enterococcus faecium]